MNSKDVIILIHLLGIVLTLLIFKPLMDPDSPLILYLMLACVGVITLNMFVSANDPIPEYVEESRAMEFVEVNSRSMLPFLITIGVFSMNINPEVLKEYRVRYTIVAGSILFSMSLLVIWTPHDTGVYARYLRDIKNILLTIGLFILIVLVVNLISAAPSDVIMH